MTEEATRGDLPSAAVAILDAVGERRLPADAPEVMAWCQTSPAFVDALLDLLFAQDLWAEARERFQIARAEIPGVGDHRCVLDAIARLGGLRPAAARRRPWAVAVAVAALVMLALAILVRSPSPGSMRETLGSEIRIDATSFGPLARGALRWTGPALAEGESFRVRQRCDGRIVDLGRVFVMEWQPGPEFEREGDCALQVQRLDSFRRVTQSSEWVSVASLAGQ